MTQLNYKLLGIVLFAILNISCKENTISSLPPSEKVLLNEKGTKDTIITKTGVYLLNPSQKEIDSLKKAMGEDNFYTVADDSNFYISKISSLLKGKMIDVENQNINFKKEKFLFKKKENKNLWLIIEYKEGSKPQLYSLVDFYSKLSSSSTTKTEEIETYLTNTDYFNVSFDINSDGKEDKIVSNKPNTGDNLLVYFSENRKYKLQLKSINFSQDGGNQISEIKKTNAGFVIKTNFPDRGFLECEYYIEYKENKWLLNNTVYKTKSSNQQNAFIYKCEVKQNLDFSDPKLSAKVKAIPNEAEREKKCTKEYVKTETKPSVVYIVKDAEGFTNLRKEKNNNSEIVQKIKTGEIVTVLFSNGDWWLVETTEKKRGYLFKDKLVIKK